MKRLRPPAIILTLLFALVPISLPAAEIVTWEVGGHAKSLNLYREGDRAGLIDDGFDSANNLRLDLARPLGKEHRFEFAVEGQVRYSDADAFGMERENTANRRLDLEKSRWKNRRFNQRGEIDRLNLSGSHSGFAWNIGRQAIGFGRITLASPLDIIAPFAPDALDTDVRPGIDALRAGRFFGRGGEIGAVAVFGRHKESNSYLLHGETNLAGVDLLALGGNLRGRDLLGGGFATQFMGMGIKGELAGYRGEEVGRSGGDPRENFLQGALELDYRFVAGPMAALQYLHNGFGAKEPKDYPAVFLSAPIQEGLGHVLGRDYLLASISHDPHPLVTLGALGIWNLQDDSFLVRPLVRLSLGDNLSLDLFWSFNQGAPSKIKTSKIPTVIPRSEFGSSGAGGGILLRHFF
jgi:hypothetical protein